MSPKRRNILIASVLLGILPVLSTKFAQAGPAGLEFLFVACGFWFSLWILEFKLNIWEYIIYPLYPCLLSYNYYALYSTYPIREGQAVLSLKMTSNLALIVIAIMLFYALFLTLNILRVSFMRTVPLKKAAISSLVMFGLLISTLTFSFIYNETRFPGRWEYQFLETLLISIGLALPILWVVQAQLAKLPLKELTVISLLLAQMSLMLDFYPANRYVKSIFISGILFVLIGLVVRRMQRSWSRVLAWEHFLLLLFLIVFLFISSVV